jgi:hypothetical protein
VAVERRAPLLRDRRADPYPLLAEVAQVRPPVAEHLPLARAGRLLPERHGEHADSGQPEEAADDVAEGTAGAEPAVHQRHRGRTREHREHHEYRCGPAARSGDLGWRIEDQLTGGVVRFGLAR